LALAWRKECVVYAKALFLETDGADETFLVCKCEVVASRLLGCPVRLVKPARRISEFKVAHEKASF
jgi:hypothetical protein